MEKRKWYYTAGGKVVRGFFCMVTFAAFMAGLIFVLATEMNFGGSVFSVNPKEYYDTPYYSSDVAVMYSDVLGWIAAVDAGKDKENENDTLRIIDATKRQIRSFDLQKISRDMDTSEIYPENMDDLEEYETDAEQENTQFYNYSEALKELETESKKGSYLYFSKQGFKKLFMKCGELNTNHRYSENFSEGAYFIFCDTGLDKKNSEDSETTEVYLEENVSVEAYDDLEVTIKSLDSDDADEEDYDIAYNDYAVYDPAEDLYYSTWDEYFDAYNSYIYDCGEVLSKLDQYTKGDRTKISNIILPLLWSENLNVQSLLDKNVNRDLGIADAKQNLGNMENDAFLYYVECGDTVYKNVVRVTDITTQPYSYFVKKGNKTEKSVKVQNSVTNLVAHGEDCFVNLLEELDFGDENVAVYFGIDQERIANSGDYYCLLSSQYKLYQEMCDYGLPVLAFTLVAFILLLIQAVSLIATTGRAGKKNKEQELNMEVQLNAFDNLPTEVWVLITLAVLLVSGIFAVVCIGDGITRNDMLWNVLLAVTTSMPFGLGFMLLTLSFARRIKAKNFSDHMCAGAVYKWCREKGSVVFRKCTGFYYKKNGAERLWFLFLGYLCCMLLGIFLVAIFWEVAELSTFGIMVILVVNICAVFTMRRIYKDMKQITACVENITKGDLNSKCEINERHSFFTELSDGVNHIGDGLKATVETSLKDERMKTELITNVSHDLKTPLTSIINYVDLLKKEEIQSEDAKHYLEVLEAKSQRLKHLTEDLVEAAKANSGNIELECMPLAFDELMRQAVGEFEDKFASKNLTVVATYPEEPAVIMADGRRLYRIIENVLQNAYKYALEGTRIYADLTKDGGVVSFTLKNVSAAQLNISPEELMERFTRGDSSRTTEGSGLGLSIAKDLTKLMEGNFEIRLDGDLFKVIVSFPEHKKE